MHLHKPLLGPATCLTNLHTYKHILILGTSVYFWWKEQKPSQAGFIEQNAKGIHSFWMKNKLYCSNKGKTSTLLLKKKAPSLLLIRNLLVKRTCHKNLIKRSLPSLLLSLQLSLKVWYILLCSVISSASILLPLCISFASLILLSPSAYFMSLILIPCTFSEHTWSYVTPSSLLQKFTKRSNISLNKKLPQRYLHVLPLRLII